MKHFTMKRGMALILAFLFILAPIKSLAHEAYFMQVLMDENTLGYQGNVLSDDSSWYGSETGHMEAQFGDFRDLIKNPNKALPDKLTDETSIGSEDYMPFSFPALEKGDGWFDGKAVNDAGRNDVDRAYLIKETLLPGLNDALLILNNNKKFADIHELINRSRELSTAISKNGGSVNGFTITVGKRASYSSGKTGTDKKTGLDSTDYLVISASGTEYEFPYRMAKGYTAKGTWDNRVYNSEYNLSGDATYITWNMMMYQAFYAYSTKGMTAKDGAEIAKPGVLEEAVTDLFRGMLNGIRNLLGLYSLNELIYNDGVRGSAAWHYGVMPNAWDKNVSLYHWIFQAIAWSLISFAIAKLLIQRNLSTINPSMRVSLISGLQDLLLTGFILAFIMPVINFLMMLNSKLVGVLAAIGPDLDAVTGVSNYSNALAGVLIQFFFLFILIYLNYTYIVRSITIAILTVLSPLFIYTLALGGHWKQLFNQWMKELVSNIFLQSFHSFILGFLFLSTISSRGIEACVICFALIPLTEFFRGMIMGQAGGVSSRVGMATVAAGAGMVMGAASSFSSQGNKRVENSKGQSSNGGSQGGSQGGGSRTDNSTSGSGGMSTGNSDRFRNNNGGSQESKTKNQDERNAQMDKQIPFDVAQKGSDSKEYKDFVGGDIKSEQSARMADLKDNLKETLTPKGVAKVGMGAAKRLGSVAAIGVGAGYAMAFGAENAGAVSTGAKLAGKGGKSAVDSAKQDLGTISEGVSTVAPSVQNAASNVADKTKNLAVKAINKVSGDGFTSSEPLQPKATTVPQVSSEGRTLGTDSSIHQRSLPNGDSQVYRDGTVLSEQGIARAYEDSNNNSVYHYDASRLNSEDANNIEQYAQVFSSGNEAQIQHLRQSGVENAAMDGAGNYVVAYNQTGKEKLGIKKVDTIGGNIVETKRADQSASTKVSFDAGYASAVPQRQRPQSNGNRNGNRQGGNTNNGGNRQGGNRNTPTPMS